ncbi:hypothetical protein INT44_005697 [Umbelopsis vinacea]|uniref:Phosphatidate phosphatase APP1 catalytic domain-containing protein n=1 Tax=Umbelopsis vinacea TaxID=44442 RepID=A0A8H7PYQ8_9FUNG|nr:hypothetical protein INT44_005697 [Umbelopsis vinacea]
MTADKPIEAPETLGQSIENRAETMVDAVTQKLSHSNQSTDIPHTSIEGTTEHKITDGVGMVGMGAHQMMGSDAMTQMMGQEAQEPRQQCMLFPTYGIPTTIDGQLHWKISVSGWLYADPPKSRMESILMAAARRIAHVTSDSEEDKRLQERSKMFFTTTIRNIEVAVRTVGFVPALGQAFTLEGPEFGNELTTENVDDGVKISTGETGHFSSELTVNADTIKEAPGKVLKIQTVYDQLAFPSYGVVDLISEHGISVVSDIDDTIKITDIPDGREVILENTFLNPTREVDGMSELYRQWAGLGAHVHYVSNGPWQLFPMLSDFFAKFNFPPGSAHLRIIDRNDVIGTIRGAPGAHKLEVIPQIMKDFPNRKFILVGDTGELDPEVYQKVYQQFPDRIVKVFIHDVTSERAAKADLAAEQAKKEAATKGTKKMYMESLREAIGLHATVTGEAHISNSAVDAVTNTEEPPTQQASNDPNVPPLTRVELFEQRIAKVSEGMREGVFKLYKDPKEIYEDTVVATAFKEPTNQVA